MPTAAFTTLGCKVNQWETQRILDSFEADGFAVVPFDSPADVYVINTCSVTSVAESKSRYTARRAARTNPDAKIVVTGCAGQMSINRDGGEFEGAHVLVPNPEKLKTLEHFLRAFPGFSGSVDASVAPAKPRGRTRATLKIQDGCDVMCSYCSIPFTRPGMTSRPAREVLDEAQKLVGMGYKEAILTGVLIGAYGPETGSGGPGFEGLVELLAAESGLERIRISSIEAHQVTEPIVRMAARGLVAPHFHVPLQSGDDGVLKAMNRRYDSAFYIGVCERLYKEVPDVAITTDIMVGFPTETDARFESSVAVCEKVGFLKAHVFRFSPRFGTPADKWGDPIAPQTKQERSKRLTEVTARTRDVFAGRFVGRALRVLVHGRARRSELLEGTTGNWLTVRMAGSGSLAGTMQWVRLDEVRGGELYGEIVAAPSPLRVL